MSASSGGSRPRTHRALTDRGRALLAAGVTLAASGVALGFVDLTRIGLLAVALPLCALALARFAQPRLQVRRTIRPLPLTVGSTSTVELEIRAASGRPCQPALGEDGLPAGFGNGARFVLPALTGGRANTTHYPVRPTRRGRNALGPVAIRRLDPFGLTSTTQTVPGSDEVVVLPQIRTLTGRLPGVGGLGTDAPAPRLVGVRGEADAAIREYRRGDDLRRIHWPVTAHRGSLMVRQETHPAQRRAVVLLDPTRAAGPGGDREDPLLDWAVSALASVAAHLAGHGYALHVLTPQTCAGEDVERPLAIGEALIALAVVHPGRPLPAGTVEDPLLTTARELASGGGLLVTAVSATAGDAREILGARPSGAAGVVFVLDPPVPAGTHAAAPRDAALDLAALAAAGGWHATVAGPHTPVEDAWTDATADAGALT